MALDENGKLLAVPKPESKKKKKTAKKTIEPVRNLKSHLDKETAVAPLVEKGVVKKRGGSSPRQSGNRIEREFVKTFGGKRVPMSGGAKHFATGDVLIEDTKGGSFFKIEVKASGTKDSKGDNTYSLTRKVLNQTFKEAEDTNEVGALFVHYKGFSIESGYFVWNLKHLKMFLNYVGTKHTFLDIDKVGMFKARGDKSFTLKRSEMESQWKTYHNGTVQAICLMYKDHDDEDDGYFITRAIEIGPLIGLAREGRAFMG